MIILKTPTKNNDKIITDYSEELFKGVPVKSVKINNKKYIVIKELEDHYGKGFSRVLKGKTTIRKIRFGSSTQSRRIVNISDLRGIFSKIVFVQPVKKKQEPVRQQKIGQPIPVEVQKAVVVKTESSQLGQPISVEVQKAVVVKTESSQLGLFDAPQPEQRLSVIDRFTQVSQMRKDISRVCFDMARDAINANGQQKSSSYNKLKENYYVKAYSHIFSEFRKILDAKLVSQGKSLESEGLQRQKNYLDVLDEKGYLDVFHSFVMSNYSKNYSKQLH
jgi:hypothetical protein